MSQRIAYLSQLVSHLQNAAIELVKQDQQHPDKANQALLDQLQQLSTALNEGRDFTEMGQELVCHIVGHYPTLTPNVPRDLFWLFGGDCLHYLGDDEISRYQQLEDRLYELEQAGKNADLQAVRAEVFGLH